MSPPVTVEDAIGAITRLFEVAQRDTGQSRIVANFLLAWWNAREHGGFDVADLFGLDLAIADDIATVVAYLGQRQTAIYADAFGHRDDVQLLIQRWRGRRGRS